MLYIYISIFTSYFKYVHYVHYWDTSQMIEREFFCLFASINSFLEERDYRYIDHLVVVVRNIAEEVPRFWNSGKNNVLVPAQRESSTSEGTSNTTSSWEKTQRLNILLATHKSQGCQDGEHHRDDNGGIHQRIRFATCTRMQRHQRHN